MYAIASDVEARLGRDLTDDERSRIDSLIEDASAVVAGYCGRDFVEPFPSAVVGVVAKMAARTLTRAAGGSEFTTQQAAGPFSSSYAPASSSGDVWLTAADKLALRSMRSGGGLASVQFVSERSSGERAETEWL